MKSYTDLEQSKKLAEILPLESADMQWIIDDLGEPFPFPVNDKVNENEEPCWSLAALLDVIPYATVNDDGEDLRLHMDKDDLQYYLFYENEYTGELCEIETDLYDDMIDACYEMILKLKEQNLL